MTFIKEIAIQVDTNIQTLFNLKFNQNSEFKAEYERFERLLNVDDRYLNGLSVGDIRHYRFKNGDAIVYSLLAETLNKGMKNYLIEVQQYVRKDVLEALITKDVLEHPKQLQEEQGLFKKCRRILQGGVDRAASFDFYIQIAIAIGIVSILFASKIVSSDVPKINNPSVSEHQAPKLPENKQNQP
ncbi:hypothetical protein [Nostoc sp. CALU 546]|uniref:hypothetical protein n=1 Tax=Nostoc sp. CALU 546 TaxID=1867241 RepID=UPI003B6700FC